MANDTIIQKLKQLGVSFGAIPKPGGSYVAVNIRGNVAYVAIQLPLTIYILESFFARIPADLFDAARMDGYSDWEIFWRVALPSC